jgi:hypothetical protein
MNLAAGFDSVTASGWGDLAGELDAWAKQGKTARLWWRDDDAVAPTPQLEALVELAADIPLGLAVIPALARSELADALDDASRVAVLQHGWCHANHGGGGKKSEFPADRQPAEVACELRAGRERLSALFGDRFVPVLAPPWNRFAPEFDALLREAGLLGVSDLAGHREIPPTGIAALDVHLDLVDWRGHRGFIGEEVALAGLTEELRARRLGAEQDTAIGILTHHLVMDAPAAAFLSELLDLTRLHRAVRWVGPAEMLAG